MTDDLRVTRIIQRVRISQGVNADASGAADKQLVQQQQDCDVGYAELRTAGRAST